MTKPNIVVTNDMGFSSDEKTRLESLGNVTYYEDTPTGVQYLDRVKNADIICSGAAGLEDVYNQIKDKYISIGFVSAAFVDLEVLKNNNVKISNAPGCNRHGVSEWITWMLLNIGRNLNQYLNSDTEFRSNGSLPKLMPGLTDKTVAILGNGNIGKQAAGICKALDMKVKFFKRGEDLHSSVSDTDFVIDTLSSNESTNGLLDKKFFKSMKKGSSFISVTRSEITNTNDLIAALDSGHLHMAAMDCGDILVGDTSNPIYRKLKDHPKILATPHISYSSEKSYKLGNEIMIDNVEAWINGKPQNLLN